MKQCSKIETFIYLSSINFEMEKKQIIETLFDQKVIKILRLFINNPLEEYYLREIAKITRVPPASTYRILNNMLDLELIEEHKNKHLKTYTLNEPNTRIFSELLEDKRSAIQEFTDFIKTVRGVDLVILHGKEEKDKASMLVVGSDIDREAIRVNTLEIKEKYKFNIIHLILAPDQYEQMLSMGLYPGKKVVLYTRI